MFSALIGNLFEVYIDTINADTECLCDQLRDQSLTSGCIAEQFVRFLLRTDASVKIPDGHPHFHILLMCVTHIICRCDRADVTVRICHMDPCRSQCRKPFRLGDPLRHRIVRILVRHIMPCHIDRVIFGNIGIILLFKLSGNILLFFVLQSLVLYISDHTICCAYLFPVLFTLNDCYFIFFLKFCQHRALYSALITHLCILFHSCNIRFSPFCPDHNMIRII